MTGIVNYECFNGAVTGIAGNTNIGAIKNKYLCINVLKT